jgi:hypothetical protein
MSRSAQRSKSSVQDLRILIFVFSVTTKLNFLNFRGYNNWIVFPNMFLCHFLVVEITIVFVWISMVQLLMQSVHITTDVVSSNLDQGEVYNIIW